MGRWNLAALALAVAAPGAPALAQAGSNGSRFVEAVKAENASTAKLLLADQPTIVDTRDEKGDTALIIAIGRADPNWTGFLLNSGADPELAERKRGDTPIIAAARVGFDQGAAWLLEKGAKVDSTNRMGETALIIAVQMRDTRLVKLLLRAGADPDKPDASAGYSARDYAKRDTRQRAILQAIEAGKAAN
jgi:ankyrin repeat protein